jgi:hypothetical protein
MNAGSRGHGRKRGQNEQKDQDKTFDEHVEPLIMFEVNSRGCDLVSVSRLRKFSQN